MDFYNSNVNITYKRNCFETLKFITLKNSCIKSVLALIKSADDFG